MGRGGKVKPNYTGINNALAQSALIPIWKNCSSERCRTILYLNFHNSKNAFDYLTLLKFEKIINSTSILQSPFVIVLVFQFLENCVRLCERYSVV